MLVTHTEESPWSPSVDKSEGSSPVGFVEGDLESPKMVRFSPDVREIPIEWHQDMPNDLRDSIWYNTIAQRHIEENVRRTLCLMNTETAIPEEYADKFCTRGLEGRTRKALKRRTLDRDTVRNAVFALQETQEEDTAENDPVMLAQVVSHATVLAQEEALKLAAKDQLEAQEYLKDLVPENLSLRRY